MSDEKDAIHQVVSSYFDAFARDPATAAAFYGEPTLFVLPNEVLALATRSNVEAFLAKLLESLKSLGYSRTKLDVPRIKMLNSTTAAIQHGRNSIENRRDGIAAGRFHLPASQRWCRVENQRSDRNRCRQADQCGLKWVCPCPEPRGRQ